MDVQLLWLRVLIAAPAAFLFVATWSVNALAQRSARRLAARPYFTSEERSRLRALKERYHQTPPRR